MLGGGRDEEKDPRGGARGALLKRLAEDIGRTVAVFLIDGHEGDPNLWASYVRPVTTEIGDQLEGQTTSVHADKGGQTSDAAILEAAHAIIERTSCAPDGKYILELLKPIWSSLEQGRTGSPSECLGVFAAFGTREPLGEGFTGVGHLTDAISLSRSARFVRAVTETQAILSDQQRDLQAVVRDTAKLAAAELGAKGLTIRSVDSRGNWGVIDLGETSPVPDGLKDIPAGTGEPEDERTALVSRSRGCTRLSISLSQQAYGIRSMKFTGAETFWQNVNLQYTPAIEIAFFAKNVTGYSQNRFSRTDEKIARAIFKNLENVVELRLADTSQTKTFETLADWQLEQASDARRYYSALQGVAAQLKAVHIGTIELLDTEIYMTVEKSGADPLPAEYVTRLKQKYLEKFYHGDAAPNYGELHVGMDVRDGHHYLEIHTPVEFGNSKIFILEFPEPVISRSALLALLNLFGEIFIRIRKDDYVTARSNTLIETRHAVVHQFAAALNGMDDIKAKWDRGLRQKEYWNSLIDDPIFPESLDLALWSLSNAQLILENGRFLVNDIDPRTIARKPINIVQIINDCLRVLRVEARRRNVRLEHAVRGEPPVTANGDERLMGIAMMNLIDNAIKYSLNRSVVRIEVIYRREEYEVKVTNSGDRLQQDRFSLLLKVGYRGQQRDRLNVRPGTGLGLPVANRIIKAHSERADLKMESIVRTDGFGGAVNTFSFSLPYLTGQGSALGTALN